MAQLIDVPQSRSVKTTFSTILERRAPTKTPPTKRVQRQDQIVASDRDRPRRIDDLKSALALVT
jgi:hypothetical protein